MSESHSSEQMLAESSRQMALQCWMNVWWKTFVWKELAVVELMTITVTACCCVSWCGGSDTPALTSVVSCRSVRPACNMMRCSTGSQCSSCSSELAWDRRSAWFTILAPLFCTCCSFWMVPDRAIYSTALQSVLFYDGTSRYSVPENLTTG